MFEERPTRPPRSVGSSVLHAGGQGLKVARLFPVALTHAAQYDAFDGIRWLGGRAGMATAADGAGKAALPGLQGDKSGNEVAMASAMTKSSEPSAGRDGDFDALVIGAGFAGLYQLLCLRDRLGLSVQALEAGGGVGVPGIGTATPARDAIPKAMRTATHFLKS